MTTVSLEIFPGSRQPQHECPTSEGEEWRIGRIEARSLLPINAIAFCIFQVKRQAPRKGLKSVKSAKQKRQACTSQTKSTKAVHGTRHTFNMESEYLESGTVFHVRVPARLAGKRCRTLSVVRDLCDLVASDVERILLRAQ